MSEAPATAVPAAELRRPRDLHERDRRFPVPGVRAQQWMIVFLLLAGTISFLVKGADGPADPTLKDVTRQAVTGFGEIAFRINRTPDATRCAILAQTALQQSRGLMGRNDLSGYDGLLFVFPADTSAAYTTRNTPLALSIAWFDAGGRFLGMTDMEPCPDRVDCPAYPAPGPHRYALEVEKGGLSALGVGQGAVISVGGPCA